MSMTGGCLCGAVRYVTNSEPVTTRICWCRVCQSFAAGNGSVNVVFPASKVVITGVTADHASVADSGRHMHRRFCPRCGVHLFSEAEARPEILVVRAGTLDDPSKVVPEANIWTASAPAWALLDARLPSFAGQPPPPLLKS